MSTEPPLQPHSKQTQPSSPPLLSLQPLVMCQQNRFWAVTWPGFQEDFPKSNTEKISRIDSSTLRFVFSSFLFGGLITRVWPDWYLLLVDGIVESITISTTAITAVTIPSSVIMSATVTSNFAGGNSITDSFLTGDPDRTLDESHPLKQGEGRSKWPDTIQFESHDYCLVEELILHLERLKFILVQGVWFD